LNCLHDLESTAEKLIACGQGAVVPLRKFLLEGRPSGIYQPRQHAVKVLARLGAKTELMEYLRLPKDISDPVVRFGEDAIESTAARELAAWQTEEVFQLLLSVARDRLRSGVVEALGEFRRTEALPLLVKALEDDVCRPGAEEALRKLGPAARAVLVRSCLSPSPSPDQETPSSLDRRRSALRLLAEVGVAEEDWRTLRSLLDQQDPKLAIPAVKLACIAGNPEDRIKAARVLFQASSVADCSLLLDVEECLLVLLRSSDAPVREEVSRLAAEGHLLSERMRRILQRVRNRLRADTLA